MNVTIIGGGNNEYCYKKLDIEFQKEIENSQFFLFNVLFFREPLDPTTLGEEWAARNGAPAIYFAPKERETQSQFIKRLCNSTDYMIFLDDGKENNIVKKIMRIYRNLGKHGKVIMI